MLLIGLGTLTVAAGGSLTRFGHHLLYGPMVLGLLIIFAGYRRVTAPGGPGGHASVTSAPRSADAEPEAAPTDATIRGEEAAGREAWPSHSRSSPPSLSKGASDP